METKLFLGLLMIGGVFLTFTQEQRPRLRDLGAEVGIFRPGPLNAITDVAGVKVGHVTLWQGEAIRTGVTAILPHGENLFQEKVPAAFFVGNGFGKFIGSTQVEELGQVETPILLTNTLCVWDIANGIVDYMLALPGNENVRSINPIVGETNDGGLNDIRGRHVTLWQGETIRTGVTAILPHGENLFQEKVPAAFFVGNGFGKFIGSTQVEELGQVETPILLTNTLSVWDVANGIVDYMLALPGNENVRSINPIVGETNDGSLNDIRGRHVKREHAVEAIRSAQSGAVAEGTVGAGTGTICFGWKGGIGTSSRVLPLTLGGFTVGALVQTNYGGVLEMAGVPVGIELGRYAFKGQIKYDGDGSCVIVVATDAPLNSAQLKRLAKRATLALGRTGSAMSHGSGDYVIAFSTAKELRIRSNAPRVEQVPRMKEDDLSPLFQAVVEATEEAIYNSLLKASTVKGVQGREVEALPIEKVKELLKKYGKMK